MSLPGVERIYLANKSLEELRTLRKEAKKKETILQELSEMQFPVVDGMTVLADKSLEELRTLRDEAKKKNKQSCRSFMECHFQVWKEFILRTKVLKN